MQSPILDAAAFPHIIDTVLESLIADSPLSALRLRTVCKGWRDATERRVFSHLYLGPSYGAARGDVLLSAASKFTIAIRMSPALRYPTQYWEPSRTPGNQYDCPCHSHERLPKEFDHALVTALGHARALDLAPGLPDRLLRCLDRFMPNLDTVRLHPNWHLGDLCPFNAAHLAFSPSIPPVTTSTIYRRFVEREGYADPHRHLIVHLTTFDRSFPSLLMALTGSTRAAALGLTVFFPHRHSDDSGAKTRLTNVPDEEYWYHVLRSAWNLASESLQANVLIVSPPPTCGEESEGEPSWTQLEAALVERRTELELPAVRDNVRFMTATEYRALVGEDRYRFDAPWALPQGQPHT